MAGLWDKFKQTAKDAGEKIAKGTKDLAQSAKLKLDISGLEGKKRSTIENLGKTVYDLFSQGKTSDDILNAIKEADEKIKIIDSEIAVKKEELANVGDDEEE